MHAFPPLPSQFLWTPQQLSDAVPLRLRHVLPFEALRGGIPAANGVRRRARPASGCLPATVPSTHFRIR